MNTSFVGLRPRFAPQPPSPTKIEKKAATIWAAVPTPLSDELNKLQNYRFEFDEKDYREYLKKFKEKYPGCSVEEPTDSGVHQPFHHSKGGNYYAYFLASEKQCQLKITYKDDIEDYLKHSGITMTRLSGGSYTPTIEQWKLMSPKELAIVLQYKEDKSLKLQKMKNNAERNRYSKVPMGNLLQLNKQRNNGLNLLKFEPTQAGLNERGKELKGLYRKSRKNRKSRKTRKNRK
jgi:hypothetical protein